MLTQWERATQVEWHPPLQIELLPRGIWSSRVLPVPGTSVSFVQNPYPYKELMWVLYDIHTSTRNFCKICTPVPQYPQLLEVLYDFHTRTRNFCEFCMTFIPVSRTSVSSVLPCHNTRNFCEFCKTFILVAETSGSSVRLPYLYPESTNPAEHNLGILNVLLTFASVWFAATVVYRR